MIEQIKYVLWKFLFASAIVAAFSGFTILADAGLPEISKMNLPAANKPADEPPVYRCPKKSFLLRTGCHQATPVKPETEAGKPQKPESIFSSNTGLFSATGTRREISDGKIYEQRKF